MKQFITKFRKTILLLAIINYFTIIINAQDTIIYPTIHIEKKQKNIFKKTNVKSIKAINKQNYVAKFDNLFFLKYLYKLGKVKLVLSNCYGDSIGKSLIVLKTKEISEQFNKQYESKLASKYYPKFTKGYKKLIKKVVSKSKINDFPIEFPQKDDKIEVIYNNFNLKYFSVIDSLQLKYPKKEIAEKYRNNINLKTKKIYNKANKEKKRFNRYVKGKSNSKYDKNMLNWNLSFKATEINKLQKEVALAIYCKKGFFSKYKLINYVTQDSFITKIPKTPLIVDHSRCSKVDKIEYSKNKLKKSLDINFFPKKYYFKEEKKQKFKFTIYFGKDKAQTNKSKIDSINDFLKKNKDFILEANISAYTSVEGDSARNANLQRKRADILYELYKKHVTDTTIKLSVVRTNNWTKFKSQIRKNKELDSLKHKKQEAILKELKVKENLKLYETFLSKQRYAEISFLVLQQLNALEIRKYANRDLMLLKKKYEKNNDSLIKVGYKNKILSIKYRLEKEILSNKISRESLHNDSIYSMFPESKLLKLFSAFEYFEKNNSLSDNYQNITKLADSAFHISERLLKKYENTYKAQEFYNVFAYTQICNYKLINAGLVLPELICKHDYKDYYDLENIYNIFVFNKIKYDVAKKTSCVNLDIVSQRDKVLTDEEKLERRRKYLYPSLKKYIFETAKKRKYKSVMYLDNLYDFVEIWENEWKPEQNTQFDKDISINDIDSLITIIDTENRDMCSRKIWTLFLNHYGKSINYYNTDNNLDTAKINKNITKLNKYYIKYQKRYYMNYYSLIKLRADSLPEKIVDTLTNILYYGPFLTKRSNLNYTKWFLSYDWDSRYEAKINSSIDSVYTISLDALTKITGFYMQYKQNTPKQYYYTLLNLWKERLYSPAQTNRNKIDIKYWKAYLNLCQILDVDMKDELKIVKPILKDKYNQLFGGKNNIYMVE